MDTGHLVAPDECARDLGEGYISFKNPGTWGSIVVSDSPGGSFRRQRPNCEVRMGRLNLGIMGKKSLEAINMVDRRKLEVLCMQETKWKEDRARTLLHAGGDGKSNGVSTVISEEIRKDVARVKR